MTRVLPNLSTSRAGQVDKLRTAAAEAPAFAPLFEALAKVLESTSEAPFNVTESFRWTPVQVQTLLLADRVLAGEL